MALFDGQIGQYTTPDGRRVSMPSGLAAGFPGLQPFAPQPDLLPVTPPVPEFAPEDRAALAPDASSAPVTTPSQVPADAPPQSVAQPPRTQSRPPTTQQLAAGGLGSAHQQESQALQDRQAATRQAAEVEANEATKLGEAIAARNVETDRILAAREQAALENQKALDARMVDYERQAKAIADTKIDRGVDHPWIAAIGVLLGAAGASMAGRQDNPAWTALQEGLKAKVAGQMADLDKRRGDLATSRDTMMLARQQGIDRLSEYTMRMDGALQQAQRQVEEIKARSGSDRVRANADIAITQIAQERGKLRGEYAVRAQTQLHQQATLAEQRAARVDAKAQADRVFKENVRQFDVREANDLEAARLQAEAQGNAARVKAAADAKKNLQETGLHDPTTGERLLTPQGQKLVDQAKKIEGDVEKARAALAKEQDPNKKTALTTRVQAAEQRAAALRGEALAEHAVRASDPAARRVAQKTLTETQAALSLIDKINAKRAIAGPKWTFATDADQEMKSQIGVLALQIKEVYQLGALDRGSQEYMDRVTGGDPTKVTVGDVTGLLDSAVGTRAALNALGKTLEERARLQLGAEGMVDPHSYQFKRDELATLSDNELKARKSLRDTVPVEEQDRLERDTKEASEATSVQYRGARGAPEEERGSVTHPGLYSDQANAFDLNLKAYQQNLKSEDKTTAGKARGAGELLVSLASDTKRPAAQKAYLSLLRDRAPDLYERAVARLPKEEKEAIATRQEIGLRVTPLPILLQTAVAGDEISKQELSRRAAAGDRDALKAIQEVIKSRAIR